MWVLAGIAVVAVSLFGFVNLLSRPAMPRLRDEHGRPRQVLRVEAYEVRDENDFDFILSNKRIGERVEVEVRAGEGREILRPALVRYYAEAPTAFLLIGVFAFLLGLLAFFRRSEDRQARIFYCAALAFGAAVLINGDIYGVHDRSWTLVPGIVLNFAYPLAPALLWRFTRTFSHLKEKRWVYAFWAVPVIIGGLNNFGFLYSLLKPSLAVFRTYDQDFFLFRWYAILVCLAAIAELVRAFRQSTSDAVRAQIKWISFGLAVGLSPFLFLYDFPLVVGLRPILSEDLSSAFFFFVPLTLTIAILRFRLMNIDLVINRSLVYSLLTIFTVGIYLISVQVLERLFARNAPVQSPWISLGAAVVAAAGFEPGRRRIQLAVDRTFFRQNLDYRKAALGFSTRAQRITDRGDLLSLFMMTVRETLPAEKVGVLTRKPSDDGPEFFVLEGVDEDTARTLLSFGDPSGEAWAREDTVKTTDGIDFTKRTLLKTMELWAVLPLPFGPESMEGCLALGRKKSGLRLTRDDFEFLEALAADLAAGLERIRLQEEIIYERASREKAVELNELKTQFISSVSHELRTPMSSIQSLSELLRSGKVGDEARRERLLHLLAGECGRLSRFVHNVLDFGKIEKGVAVYDLRPAPVQPPVLEVADIFRSAAPEGLNLRVEAPGEPVVVDMDPDAVRQALLNLVDNAIKYSKEEKIVALRVVPREDEVEIQVEDRGIGIGPEIRQKIFEPFFRSSRAAEKNPRGVGLGLCIVKNIMDGHGGRVGLKSEPGKGSTFSLIFVRRRRR